MDGGDLSIPEWLDDDDDDDDLWRSDGDNDYDDDCVTGLVDQEGPGIKS